MNGNEIRSVAAKVAVPLVVLGAWELAVRLQLLPPSQAAAPTAVIARLAALIRSGELLPHAGFSLGRIIVGVLLGGGIGVLTGVTLGRLALADQLLSPMIQLLAGIPVVVWIPFWVMLFGTQELFKVAMVAISTFFIVHLHTFLAVRAVGRPYLELADLYEKSAAEKLREVLLPSAAPAIFTALRTSLAFCWVVMFFVEYASSKRGSEGLGWFIADARQVGKIEEEFAGLVFLGAIAYFSDRLLAKIQSRMLRWADTGEVSQHG